MYKGQGFNLVKRLLFDSEQSFVEKKKSFVRLTVK